MNFYCGGDPPCDSLLAGHRNSETSTSSSESSPVPESSSSGSTSEEEDDSADDEPNVWNSNYARSCLSTLKGDKLLKPLIEVLYTNSCLKDFMTLVTSISDKFVINQYFLHPLFGKSKVAVTENYNQDAI